MTTSVAMCTYNGEKFITTQIDSILNQTQKITEIVVCDDGSVDGTVELLENYSLKYVGLFKIYKNPEKLGSIKNFEKALSLCTSEIIFLSDQDDVWIENKVADLCRHFENNLNIEVIATNGYCLNENGSVEENHAVWDVPYFLKENNKPCSYFDMMIHIANIATGASMAIRKSIINRINPIPILTEMQHDEWIALLSSKNNAFLFLHEKYFYYRIHCNQQLGGVFFEKTEIVKKQLTNYFDLHQPVTKFIDGKKRIKKLCLSYEKNKYRIVNDTRYSYFFADILSEIENDIYICRKHLKKRYPLRYFLLCAIDRFSNKRQIVKLQPNTL